jgi:hypothetical protein
LSLGMSACGNSREASYSQTPAESVDKAKLVDDFGEYRSAATTIKSILIKGDLMTIHVTFSGGCEEHEFKLLGQSNLQKSMPLKRGVMLFHDNKGDSCRELKDEILVFDITALGVSKTEVLLLIDGHETPHPYKAP